MTRPAQTRRPDALHAAKRLPSLLVALLAVTVLAERGAAADCLQPNVGGSIALPATCDVTAPNDPFVIVDGLPFGTTIEVTPTWHGFANVVAFAGGIFPGGEIQQFDGLMELEMDGTGTLAGFQRHLFMQVAAETHSSAKSPGDASQTLDIEIVALSGVLIFDPDFDSLSFEAGVGFGLPSSGTMHLLRQGGPGSDFEVESVFDLSYRIEFLGAAGSVLDGYAGTTDADSALAQGESAWNEWGPGKPCGSVFVPNLSAHGPLSVGSINSMAMDSAPPTSPAFLVLGLAPLDAPFKGGILGPSPDVILDLATDAQGEFQLVYEWPLVPAGTRIWAQTWVKVAGSPDPFCATQTLVGTSQ
jgi:hypothetical protein